MRAVLGLSVRPTRNVWSIFRDGPKNDFAARLCPERWAECGGSGSAAGNFGRPSGPRWAAGHRTMFSSAGRLRNGAARAGAEGLRRHVLSVLMFSYVTDSGVWLYVPDSGGRSRHLVRVIPTFRPVYSDILFGFEGENRISRFFDSVVVAGHRASFCFCWIRIMELHFLAFDML